MSIWNFISEFAFFRWLFDNDQDDDNNAPRRKSTYSHKHSSNSYRSSRTDWRHQSDNYFHEEQDDYDMMDDF